MAAQFLYLLCSFSFSCSVSAKPGATTKGDPEAAPENAMSDLQSEEEAAVGQEKRQPQGASRSACQVKERQRISPSARHYDQTQNEIRAKLKWGRTTSA